MNARQLEELAEKSPADRVEAMQQIRRERAVNAIFDLFELDMELRGQR